KDLILDESLQDLELYPELIQPSLSDVLQCKVLQEPSREWDGPSLLSSLLCHVHPNRREQCFLQSFISASAAVKINTAPGPDYLFQHCPMENYITSFNSLIC
ncbi:hypothetical protein N320_00451, partial [Buceros rhinoceros silvestris]